jgi:hypothetical protein
MPLSSYTEDTLGRSLSVWVDQIAMIPTSRPAEKPMPARILRTRTAVGEAAGGLIDGPSSPLVLVPT